MLLTRRAALIGSVASTAMAPEQRSAVFGDVGPSLDLNFLGPNLDARITFTRASTGWYFDSTGTLQSAASNVPRFDYNPATLEASGLLIEEARTNLLLNSTTLSTQSVTVTTAARTLSFYGTGSVVMTGVFSGTLAGVGATTRVQQTFTPTAGSLTLTVSGTVNYANLEVGAAATSPIITAGTSVTRAVDVANMPLLTGPAFSLAAEVDTYGALVSAASQYSAQIDDGSTANRMVLYRLSTNGAASVLMAAASVNFYNDTSLGVIALGATYKSAGAYTNTVNKSVANGGAITKNSTAGAMAQSTTLRLGCSSAGANQLNGHLRRVRYWVRVLPDAELQSVTA